MTGEIKEENVVSQVNRGSQAGKIAIFISVLAIMIAAGAFSYSYLQLTKQNVALTQHLETLQQQVANDATHMQTLAQSIQQLQQVDNANNNEDITAIYARLVAVNVQLDQLPLPPAPLQPEPAPTPAIDESNLSWWQKGLNRSLDALRQIVIVRYNENKVAPLVLPEERRFLYLNLHTEMQNAIWGVLHRNPAVYHTSLARVTNWVKQYFIQQSPETANVLQELTALQTVNVEPQNKTGA